FVTNDTKRRREPIAMRALIRVVRLPAGARTNGEEIVALRKVGEYIIPFAIRFRDSEQGQLCAQRPDTRHKNICHRLSRQNTNVAFSKLARDKNSDLSIVGVTPAVV